MYNLMNSSGLYLGVVHLKTTNYEKDNFLHFISDYFTRQILMDKSLIKMNLKSKLML